MIATRTMTVLVCCVLLAGCGAPLGGGDRAADTPTLTPVAPPTDDPATRLVAPGVTASGSVEAATLADSHVSTLSERSYRLRTVQTVYTSDGQLRERFLVDTTVRQPDRFLSRVETTGPSAPVILGRPPASASFWSNGTVYLRALSRDGETTYNEYERASQAASWRYWARTAPFGGSGGSSRTFIADVFGSVQTTRVPDAGAASSIQLAGDRADGPLLGVAEPRNLTLEATVSEEGYLVRLVLRFTGELEGESVRVSRRVVYSEVGTARIERPPWTGRALTGSG